MVVWREKLYLDEQMGDGKKLERLKRLEADRHLLFSSAYGIFLAQNPDNLLEIISFRELAQPGYRKHCFICVGVACCQETAEELVRVILQETIQVRGDTNVREYLYPTEEGGESCCL